MTPYSSRSMWIRAVVQTDVEGGYMNEWHVVIILVVVLVVVLAALAAISSIYLKRKQRKAAADEFGEWKRRIKPYSSADEFEEYFRFLRRYQGGYVKVRDGRVVGHDYLGRERGDLKGIFFHVVVPNAHIPTERKEDFRYFLMAKKVTGLEKRPSYETRDSVLKNFGDNADDYERKRVGNVGEQIVRDVLDMLEPADYAVINGAALKCGDTIKEYDHIIVGRTGVFCMETKAFGMTDGMQSRSTLVIDESDNWSVRKGDTSKSVKSPTAQMNEERRLLQRILKDYGIKVHSVLVLSNRDMNYKRRRRLPYDIVSVNKLIPYIKNYHDVGIASDRGYILQTIDDARIN